jgi:hypothetical protein
MREAGSCPLWPEIQGDRGTPVVVSDVQESLLPGRAGGPRRPCLPKDDQAQIGSFLARLDLDVVDAS